jgi:hypothetical protein
LAPFRLAVNGRTAAVHGSYRLKPIPPVSLDLQALIRKYGGPSVLDCPPPLSLPDDDAVVAPASPLLLALAQASQLALGITEEDASLFE